MKAPTPSGLLDVVLIVSSGEAFATKKIVSFLFNGKMKQLESYISSICQLWPFRVDTVVSVYDVDAGKYIYKLGGLE